MRQDLLTFWALCLSLAAGATVMRAVVAAEANPPAATTAPTASTIPTASQTTDPAESPPLVITAGGTYRGNWRSDDAETPVITIRTSEPVIIEHSTLHGRGHLIDASWGHPDLTVRHTKGYGLNPNVAGRVAGRFITIEDFVRLVVERNDLDGTAGIYALTFHGSRAAGATTVRVIGNRVRNVDGRKSDGGGGYLPFNRRVRKSDGRVEEGYELVQFLQLDKVTRVPGMEVAWNEVINEPGRSRVEDNVNIYKSGGTPDSPLRIHDNYVRGAYTIDPARSDAEDDVWRYDWGYSGGGLMLGDGPGKQPDDNPAYVVARDNVVVGTSNYGIAIAAGHDISFAGNRIVSAGVLPDGRPIATQNVGAYVWDTGNKGRPRSRALFFNNGGTGNVIGWTTTSGGRNDNWTPDADAWVGNAALPGRVRLSDETREHCDWLARAARAGVSFGAAHENKDEPAR